MDEKTKHIKVGIFVNGNRKIRKGDELVSFDLGARRSSLTLYYSM